MNTIKRTVDLAAGVTLDRLDRLFAQDNKDAHIFDITVMSGGEAVDLSDANIKAYMILADESTVPIEGAGHVWANGNVVSVMLDEHCYIVPGHFSLIINASLLSSRTAIYWADGTVTRTMTDTIIDPGNVIPSLDELLDKIAEIDRAIKAADEAVERAEAAEGNIAEAEDRALQAVENAEEAVSKAQAWANADVSIEMLPENSQPQVSVGKGEDGNMQIDFSIPRGKTGDPGKDMRVLGTFDTFELLAATVTNAAQGDLYNVGTEAPFTMYMWDNGAWVSQGSIGSAGVKLLDVYPVGSIYMSVNSTDPSELFGGWWEQLKDRFLLGAGATYAAGETGGEAKHKLTVAELASHFHKTYVYSPQGSEKTSCPSQSAQAYVERSTTSAGGDQPHNNMPPYLTVYMWRRIDDQEVA